MNEYFGLKYITVSMENTLEKQAIFVIIPHFLRVCIVRGRMAGGEPVDLLGSWI